MTNNFTSSLSLKKKKTKTNSGEDLAPQDVGHDLIYDMGKRRDGLNVQY